MKKLMIALNKSLTSEFSPLYVLIIISGISHFTFVLKGFGETDAANVAVSTIDYIAHGANGFLTGRYFVDIVPLYVLYLKYFIKLLDNNYQYILMIMNYTNAVFGTLIIIPVYFLTRKLFSNNTIAFYTALTFIITPSVFQSSIYGFPHLLALFFFITSLYFFLVWLDDTNYICLISSFISLAVSILLKSDLILGSGAYFGLLYMRKVKEKGKIISPVLIIILSFLSLLILRHLMGIERGHTASVPDFFELIKSYTALLSSRGVYEMFKLQAFPILYAVGILNFFVAGFAFIYYVIKRTVDVVVFVLAWTAVPTVFWLLIYGNSARHNMISVLPFIMIISLFLYQKARRYIGIFTVIIILGNFLVPYPTVESGNIDMLTSYGSLNSKVQNIHSVAKGIADLKDNKIIIAPPAFTGYLYYEIISLVPKYKLSKIAFGNSCYMLKGDGRKYIICTTISDTGITDIMTEYDLEKPAIILPVSLELNLTALKEKGLKIYEYDRLNGSMKTF